MICVQKEEGAQPKLHMATKGQSGLCHMLTQVASQR